MTDFDYSTLLPMIDALLRDTPPSANVRTAASRAYYSAYGTLRKRIVTECGSDCFSGAGLHSALIRVCTQHGSTTGLKTVGTQLKSLLVLREAADYRWTELIEVEQVRTAKTNAGRLVSKINFLNTNELSILYRGVQAEADKLRR